MFSVTLIYCTMATKTKMQLIQKELYKVVESTSYTVNKLVHTIFGGNWFFNKLIA